MPTTSYECRWFFKGALPDGLAERFWAAGAWQVETGPLKQAWPDGWREDRYVVLAESMGLKVRREPAQPSRFELKGLVADHGTVAFGAHARGRAGEWIKWSYANGEAPKDLALAVSKGRGTIRVFKKRTLRNIQLDSDGHGQEIDPRITLAPSQPLLQLELTRLQLPDREKRRKHWTLSFEASPAAPGLAEIVHRAVEPFFESLAGCGLELQRSLSYPEWLQRLD